MKPKVVCLRSKDDFERVGVVLPGSVDYCFFPAYDEEQVARASADADFILAPSPYHPITARIISRARSLKLIQMTGSGVDAVDLEAADRAGIPVANCPGQNSKAVAQLAFTAMGALCRGILEADYETKKGNYLEIRRKLEGEGMYELENLNLGLLGLGFVGKEMARIGAFFGARVYYYDIVRLVPEEEREREVTFAGFRDLLKMSDIISLHLPINKNTEKLIGRQEFALMKPGAVFINTSRGAIIDPEALIDSLKSKKLKGAAIDAFDPEPLPPDHPLLSVDEEVRKRLILTPHIGASTRQSFRRMFEEGIANVLRVVNGERARYVVNLKRI
jgi:phosphoglycerate dehydrogenase-like enzyme